MLSKWLLAFCTSRCLHWRLRKLCRWICQPSATTYVNLRTWVLIPGTHAIAGCGHRRISRANLGFLDGPVHGLASVMVKRVSENRVESKGRYPVSTSAFHLHTCACMWKHTHTQYNVYLARFGEINKSGKDWKMACYSQVPKGADILYHVQSHVGKHAGWFVDSK